MRNTIFKRTLVLLLALCMMVSVFAACATDESGESSESNSIDGATVEVEGVPTDEGGHILDAIPDDFKIDDTFRILGWSEQKSQYYIKEQGDNVVANAVYNRNMAVEDRLQVQLDFTFVEGNWEKRSKFTEQVKSTSDSGMAYDALICYNLVPYVFGGERFG